VVKPGCVYDVDFIIAPFGVQHGGKNGVAAFLFYLVKIGYRIFSFNGSSAVGDTGFKNHIFGKQRLAAFRGSQQYNVFQVFFIVDFHMRRILMAKGMALFALGLAHTFVVSTLNLIRKCAHTVFPWAGYLRETFLRKGIEIMKKYSKREPKLQIVSG